jgi:hypothetical protein
MSATQTTGAPPTPSGYREPYSFSYSKLGMNIGAVLLVLIMTPLLSAFTWLLQGNPPFFDTSLSGWGMIGFSFVIAVITIVVHELIHGLAYVLMGYHVSFGVYWKLGLYTAALRQFQKRDHILISALAPVVLLMVMMLPMLAIHSSLVVETAFIVLLVNTSGAFGDLYLAWRLLHVPRYTLAFDADSKNSFIYEPEVS